MQRCVDCRYFDEALRYNPDHRQSLFNSAVLLQELGQPELRPRATQRSVRHPAVSAALASSLVVSFRHVWRVFRFIDVAPCLFMCALIPTDAYLRVLCPRFL